MFGAAVYFCFGNHDADNVPALRSAAEALGATCLGWGGEVVLAGKRVAVTHGHMRTDVRRLLATQPDYLLSGHLHIRSDRRDGSTRRINPGALHEADEFTVGLLDLGSDSVRFLAIPPPLKMKGDPDTACASGQNTCIRGRDAVC